jgi:hypothetical protein
MSLFALSSSPFFPFRSVSCYHCRFKALSALMEPLVWRVIHQQTQLRVCFVWFSPLVRLTRVRCNDKDAWRKASIRAPENAIKSQRLSG